MQNQLRPGNPRVHFGKLRVPNPTATPKDPRKKQGAEGTRRKDHPPVAKKSPVNCLSSLEGFALKHNDYLWRGTSGVLCVSRQRTE